VADTSQLVINGEDGRMTVGKVIVDLLEDGLRYVFKRLLPSILIISACVAISFLITKGFSITAFSDRLVWVGIGLNVVSLFLLMAQMYSGKDYGLGSMVRSVSEARRLMEHNLEIREKIEKRYEAALLVWLSAMGVLGLGALVEIIFA
jgi:hypothetical protein